MNNEQEKETKSMADAIETLINVNIDQLTTNILKDNVGNPEMVVVVLMQIINASMQRMGTILDDESTAMAMRALIDDAFGEEKKIIVPGNTH